jgi:hypothetical protein
MDLVCPQNHLMGTVSNNEILVGSSRYPLRASHTIQTYCPKCPRTAERYDVRPDKIRALLKASRRKRRLRVRVQDLVDVVEVVNRRP